LTAKCISWLAQCAHCGERREVRHVQRCSALAFLRDLCNERFAALAVAAMHDDVRARRSETARDFAAETVRRSRDEDDLAVADVTYG
jgi:hypothetical protein